MSSLRLLLGLIPSTSKIEQAEKALVDELEKLHAFTKSDVLAKYTKLHDLVNSTSFIQKRKETESLRFKDSEEYNKEKEFLSLHKAKDILLYFKTISGSTLKDSRILTDLRRSGTLRSSKPLLNQMLSGRDKR